MTISDNFSYYGYSLGWASVRKMSDKRAYRTFDRLADNVWKRHGKSVQQYEKNVRRVVPDATNAEISDLSRQCMRSYARYWCDAFRMPDWTTAKIASLPVKGLQNAQKAMDDAQNSGSPSPVFVVPHSGNYDYGAAFLAQHFNGVTTVAERLKPDKLFDKFVDFRANLDVEVVGTGTPNTLDILADRARAGRISGLVGERDLSRNGIPVNFFGQEARMPAGAAVLARRLGVSILPVSFWYEGRQAKAEIYPPIDVPQDGEDEAAIAATTQAWADKIAIGIAEHPEDWHMLQPLWVADLDPARDPMRLQQSGHEADRGPVISGDSERADRSRGPSAWGGSRSE
jgi:lauroyl/myristoyl acyltransferase